MAEAIEPYRLKGTMTPYFEHRGITIYHGDCRQVLPRLDGRRWNLVLTDPPYSVRTHHGARTNRAGAAKGRLIDFRPINESELLDVFALCARQLSGWLVTFLDWRHVAMLEHAPPDGLRFVRFGIWDKPNGTPQISGDRPAMGWEAIAILHSTPGRMRWHGGGHRALWSCERELNPLHPAQKPLRLVKRLACLFATEGDLILDPFMGSGTTLRAAKDIGCGAIGIETDERYCEIAANRLRQEVLF